MQRLPLHTTLLLLVLCLPACQNPFAKKKTNWEVSLQKEDKKPYGSYIAYQSLKHYFPGAKTEVLSTGFRYTSIDGYMHFDENGRSLLILLGLDFNISSQELEELKRFAANGNEIMLFCSRMDTAIEGLLKCYKHGGGGEGIKPHTFLSEKSNRDILTLNDSNNQQTYGHEGRALYSYFTVDHLDSTTTTTITDDAGTVIQYEEETTTANDETIVTGPDTLGFASGMPDFLRYAVGDGHITIHAAPLVLSNYFLLQKGNKAYLDAVWHSLPANISHVYWNEYYKRRAEGSEFSVLWRYPATRWALILAIFTLVIYVLFESRRRQKIIPVIEQPENTSLSFTETVGRLYYNKGNHSNIAEKMIQHFLEWVRTHYHLNTNHLNYDFIQHLSKKTGEPEQTVSRLVEMIHEIRTNSIKPDEPYLYELYTTIQRFYKNKEH